jgi:alkane 1-monooxygenase
MPVIARYAIVTLTPLALLLLGAMVRGEFALAALVWLTLLAAVLDGLLERPAAAVGAEPWATRLSVVLALGHLVLLPVALVALAGPALDLGQKIALFLGTASFVGQVSHPNAHELIHRDRALLRGLGAAVYVSVGFGHHVSAHRRVHHRHVGSYDDPATPLPGESFWPYVRRAWAETFRAGLDAEEERLEARGHAPRSLRNPYWFYVGGEGLALVGAALVAGPVGILAYLGLVLLSGGQILLSDYVQHYGLRRLELPSGRLEPVGPHHSWNAPRGFSSYLMLNAPSHSEHHLHPARRYAELGSGGEAPTLPFSLPIMAMLATVPPVWHRLMDRRALRVMEAAEARIAADAARAEKAQGPVGDAEGTVARATAAPCAADGARAPGTSAEDAAKAQPSSAAEPVAVPAAPIADPADDQELIRRIQILCEPPEALAAEDARLKLRRPVRSARRAAPRDR